MRAHGIGWRRDTPAEADAGQRRAALGEVFSIVHALGERTERLIRRILTWHG